jgi:sulfur-carrier protein
MPHVTLSRHLQRFFPTLTDGEVAGATIRALVDELDRRHPGLATYIIDETGRLRRHVNIFIGDDMIHDRERLGDEVRPDDKVWIMQALSGG